MHGDARDRWCVAAIGGLGVAAAAGLALAGPIPQDPAYHCFADGRTLLGIPNFWNVVTNAPFVATGAVGLVWLARTHERLRGLRAAFAVFFAGVLCTGIGSAYYHWAPDNPRLVWDRLPLQFAFMALVALAIHDRLGARAGRAALGPLVVAGPATVVWWGATDDVRWYALAQFYPMLAIPLLLCCFPGRRFRTADWWVIAGCYAAAKATELLDHPVHEWLGFSGHSLKHLLAAGAPLWVPRLARPRPAA